MYVYKSVKLLLHIDKSKGEPIFRGRDGEWMVELEQRMPTDEIVLLALAEI